MDKEIDDLINEMDGTEEISNFPTEIGKTELIDLEEKNELANKIVENSLSIITNAKTVFDNFSADVLLGRDRSNTSKEMLISALNVQNDANKNLIALAKVLKEDTSKVQNNILLGNAVSAKKEGIDFSNMETHFDD